MQDPHTDIALINVVRDGDYQYEQEIPLGIACLAAFLRARGYAAPIHQCFSSRGDEEVERAAAVEAPVFGFQVNMANYTHVKLMAERLKEKRPDVITVIGGPFLVTLSETILSTEPVFDFAVLGEGEQTCHELLMALERRETDFSEIDGLVWKQGERIVRNEIREAILDLDTLPFPARDFLDTARQDPVDGNIVESIRVVTSRGCIGTCTFCCVNLYNKTLKGKRWRGRSPGHVVDELEVLVRQYGARVFNFADSSFEDPGTYGKQRAREICEEIIRRGLPLSAKVYMRCETMTSHEDIELLRLYKRAGIDVVIPGAESGSDYELRYYGKRASIEDNIRTIKTLRDLDLFFVLVGFIMFGPNSTTETLLANLDFIKDAGFSFSLIMMSNVLILIRHSKLYNLLKEEGRVIESADFLTLPKYEFLDPVAEKMAALVDNLYARYPAAEKVAALQVNVGNLISRMKNPMNARVLDALEDEYEEFKRENERLNGDIGALNHAFFRESLLRLAEGTPQEEMEARAAKFFNETQARYIPLYANLHDGFLARITRKGFGLSGLVFKHFLSAIALDRPYEEEAQATSSGEVFNPSESG